MVKYPLVSIIIPTFNRAETIRVALDSVMGQSYSNWECLIVDDGSIDYSVEVFEQYSKDARIKYFKRDKLPKGAPTCRNIGLNKAEGDLIIYLDSDDLLLPKCLEQRVIEFLKHPDFSFLVFPMGVKKGNVVVEKRINPSDDHLILFLSASLPWQTMCPIWKKSFLNSLGGFTEGYPRLNDPELMIRALVYKEISYKVIDYYGYDCIHLPSAKNNTSFTLKTYHSLKLFIPDMVKVLDLSGKSVLKKYLVLYLHLWFKYFYVVSSKRNFRTSLNLIVMFNFQRIISLSKCLNLMLRLAIYNFTNIILKKPINKITDKAIYLN